MSYRIINGQAYSVGNIGQFANSQKAVGSNPNSKQKEAKFQDVLDGVKNRDQSFTISKHAASRLNEINFTKEDMEQIQKGFKIAQDKNSKNTVMLYKDIALIASVENKTLITAVEKDRAKDNIFTNVDSVVIL
ncbi:TIGR02530 family flagellar biosynthesis protein [Clostridium beijerinckii]|uniref:TIGR02530 family flagellar biosynthesis protein n=1 Tax=Clostridium beijerinckii TaxID=1520 RepID=UPI0013611E19|nr:TIGR02530 family flagellar biosynthesis protein [Clostridium beijerinckii]MZK49846.1 flagellar biosynthesis protein [Clostridium beijerinckii]MZK57805.1 flagellar biosynthesis protein [Clostridium beijerinckii]MZK68016.1 flagellar biosynthesis protein [Clostridium beijerinckii]MZK73513.1 flagellar biosynthesis protein [Clostridium beijerinckii]MZK83096.1 flagellar biosynthesis protein [Clostridium beijerinckii]